MVRRSVSLLVGTRSYSFTTSLGKNRLHEVHELLQEVMAETDHELQQDERLFLSCMVLASELLEVSVRLREAVKRIDPSTEASEG